MKQLFIIPSGTTYPTDTTVATDGTNLSAGQMAFAQMAGSGDKRIATLIDKEAKVGVAPNQSDMKEDDIFFIYGRGENSQVITGVIDALTHTVTKASPKEGVKFSREITLPVPEKGLNYSLELQKKGVVFHERNLWTVTDTYRQGKVTTAEQLAESLGKQLEEMNASDKLNIKVTVTGAKIKVEGEDYQDWNFEAVDDAYGLVTADDPIQAQAPICDKEYVKHLASVCAQNRGFNNTYADGATIYPGYPMELSDDWYDVYTIHYKYGRKAARTRDESIWQDVIIAVGRAKDATGAQKTGIENEDYKSALPKIFVVDKA